MGAGKSAGKSRLSGRRGDDRSSKRHKVAPAQRGTIRQFLQPVPRTAPDSRETSSEPEDGAAQQPSKTPAVALLAAAAPPPSGAPTAAGAMLQTAVLNSLQHRFATQQALDTPAGWGAEQAERAQGAPAPAAAAPQEEEVEEEGFQIFSQLAYEPTFLSQRPAEPEHEPGGGTSQLPTQTQAELPCPSQLQAGAADQGGGWRAGRGGDDLCGDADDLDWPCGSQHCTQPQLSQQQQQQQAEQFTSDALRRVSGTSAAALKTTPALHSSERVPCDGAGASGQKVFPLFRRRDSVKKLYIVRHGESTCNAAMAARGSGWADPQIFDAQLTGRGKQQARALRQHLATLELPPDTLWVTSPLQRAMQTLLLACPHAHLLGGAGAAAGDAENSSAAPNGGSGKPPSVAVLQHITEKVITCGDIGSPASELAKQYPQLGGQLAALPELWWHCPPDKPNCAVQRTFGCSESKEQVLSRIGAFRRWLQDRPERVIVAVGHSSYWRTFEEVCRGTKPNHMRNCECRLIHF